MTADPGSGRLVSKRRQGRRVMQKSFFKAFPSGERNERDVPTPWELSSGLAHHVHFVRLAEIDVLRRATWSETASTSSGYFQGGEIGHCTAPSQRVGAQPELEAQPRCSVAGGERLYLEKGDALMELRCATGRGFCI